MSHVWMYVLFTKIKRPPIWKCLRAIENFLGRMYNFFTKILPKIPVIWHAMLTLCCYRRYRHFVKCQFLQNHLELWGKKQGLTLQKLSITDYIGPNSRAINGWWTGKFITGSGCCTVFENIPSLARNVWEIPHKLL